MLCNFQTLDIQYCYNWKNDRSNSHLCILANDDVRIRVGMEKKLRSKSFTKWIIVHGQKNHQEKGLAPNKNISFSKSLTHWQTLLHTFIARACILITIYVKLLNHQEDNKTVKAHFKLFWSLEFLHWCPESWLSSISLENSNIQRKPKYKRNWQGRKKPEQRWANNNQ